MDQRFFPFSNIITDEDLLELAEIIFQSTINQIFQGESFFLRQWRFMMIDDSSFIGFRMK